MGFCPAIRGWLWQWHC